MLITSVNNKRIKDIVKLKDKKYRDEQKLFLIEGSHLVEEAYKNKLLKTLIVLENVELELDVETIYVSEEVMKKISEVDSSTKVIGIAKKKRDDEIGKRILILDGVQDPGNLGTLIRSAKAFNFETIVLSEDTVDLYNGKVIRSTQGLLFSSNIIKRELVSFIKDLKKDNYLILGTKVNEGIDIDNLEVHDKIAVILGNEGKGVKPKVSRLCDEYLFIKMNENCESLNVAVAGSVFMYELNKK